MPEKLTETSCSYYDLPVGGDTLRLHAGRFAEWKEEKTIFIADAHFGKIAHFRRAGINLPGDAGADTFKRLTDILETFRPQRLIVLGDLFHSDFNEDFPRFAAWRQQFTETDVWLIPGNHDRAGQSYLHEVGLVVKAPQVLGPFFLQHEPAEISEGFLLCGHLHPGLSLGGRGRQHVQMPAFWLSGHMLCFPAFGSFTGNASVQPHRNDVFFAVAGNELRKIPASIL